MRNTPPTPRRVRPAHDSKSATVRAAAAAPSRRQQSKWQREQYQQRTLYLAIGGLVLLVGAIFVGGLVYDNVVRGNEVVAQVGPDTITSAQLLDQVRPAAKALDTQAKQYATGANSQSIADYVDQQKRSLPDSTLNDMIDDHNVQQEADRRGISVSSSAVDDKERQTVAEYQVSVNPSPTATPDVNAAATAAPTLAPTPDSAATAFAIATSAVTTPTAVPTLEGASYADALQKLLDANGGLTEAQFRTQLQQGLLRDQLQTAIGTEQFPDTQEQIHLRQIVVATADQANTALSQIQGGADFATLAQQLSTDTASKSNGGDLGWVSRGTLDKPIEDAAFALQPGQLSDVIQGSSGYYVLQVIDRDPARAVPADQLTTQRQKAFSDWLDSRRSSQDVKLQLTDSQKNWILSRIGVRP